MFRGRDGTVGFRGRGKFGRKPCVAAFINGGFETGDFTGWSCWGDGTVSILSNGAYEGDYYFYCVIPATPHARRYLIQTIYCAKPGQKLRLRYKIVTGEIDIKISSSGNVHYAKLSATGATWTLYEYEVPEWCTTGEINFQTHMRNWHVDYTSYFWLDAYEIV